MIRKWLVMAGVLAVSAIAWAKDGEESRCFELRIYKAAPGKMEQLHSRFRDHTCKLFEKHGMTNIGYWTPIDPDDQRLIYLLAYPDRAARNKSWGKFMTDPEWLAAWKASEQNGKLVSKSESTILHAADYSPTIATKASGENRVFELRTYLATPGNLDRLNARFRDHTISLFSKHGMEHIGYWLPDRDQPSADVMLVYILAHTSKDARDASFKEFGADPNWKAAREASEKEAGGSLTAPEGVKSVLMVPTDYSPTK